MHRGRGEGENSEGREVLIGALEEVMKASMNIGVKEGYEIALDNGSIVTNEAGDVHGHS